MWDFIKIYGYLRLFTANKKTILKIEWLKMDSVAVYGYPQMVEAAGVEPASEDLLQKDSPSADSSLIFLCITRVSNSYRVSPLTPSAMANHRVRLPANLKPGYSSRHLAGLLPKLRQLVRNYFRRLFFIDHFYVV